MFRVGFGIFVLIGGLLGAVACGGSSDASNESGVMAPQKVPASSQTMSDEAELDFVLSDFKIQGPQSVDSGLVRFNVANEGLAIHELVIVQTDTAVEALPMDAGVVVETELDIIGDIAEIQGGETRSEAFMLDAGRYLLICNVPGHFTLQMVSELNVD